MSIAYGSWLKNVLFWDTLLPACVAIAPILIKGLFPTMRGALEVTAVLLPVAAFGCRLLAGRRRIATNRCSGPTRKIQLAAFILGLFPLALIECVVILSGLMPNGFPIRARADRIVFAALLSAYLAAMVFAMYPGRSPVATGGREQGFDDLP